MQEHLVDHSNFLETQKNFLERQNRDVAQVVQVDTSSQERKSTFVEGTSTSYQENIEIEDGAEREVGADSDAILILLTMTTSLTLMTMTYLLKMWMTC